MNTNQRLKLSLLSSLFSKLSTLVLQLISMPIAVTNLGQTGFVLFSVLISLNAWLILTTVGLSPALTVKIAGNRSKKNIKRWTATALVLMIVIACSVSFLIVLLNYFGVFQNILPTSSIEFNENIQRSILIIVFGFLFQCICVWSDAIVLARQNQFLTNCSTLLAALFSIGCLYFFKEDLTLPSDFLAVVFLPGILSRSIVGATYILRRDLIQLNRFNLKLVKVLIRVALRFFKVGGLTNFFMHVAPVLIVSSFFSIALSAKYVAINTLIVLASSIVGMLLLPMIPAIRAAVKNDKKQWLNRALNKLSYYCLTIGCLTLALGWTLGEQVLNWYFDSKIEFGNTFVGFASLYFATLIWSNYCYCLFAAHDKIEILSSFFIKKSIASVSLLALFALLDIDVNPFIIFVLSFLVFELTGTAKQLKKLSNG